MSINNRENELQLPNPIKLSYVLDGLDTDRQVNNYLRTIFLEPSEIDSFLETIKQYEEPGLSRKEKAKFVLLKDSLVSFRDDYLPTYLEGTAKRIGRFEARQKENTELLDKHIAEPEIQEKLFKTRRRISQAMRIANQPVVNGKSLREMAIGNTEQRLSQREISDIHGVEKVIDESENISLEERRELKEKFREIFKGYDRAVKVAREFNSNLESISLRDIANAVAEMGVDKLREIAKFGKPVLQITPQGSLDSLAGKMGKDVYINRGQFKSEKSSNKTVVSIVDAQPSIPISGDDKKLNCGERRDNFKADLAKKGMRLMTSQEYMVLQKLCWTAYEEAKERGEDVNVKDVIADYYQSNGDTYTCLDDTLTDSSLVPCADFSASNQEVDFNYGSSVYTSAGLRGRPSVQVMER